MISVAILRIQMKKELDPVEIRVVGLAGSLPLKRTKRVTMEPLRGTERVTMEPLRGTERVPMDLVMGTERVTMVSPLELVRTIMI